jgi:hypothetical protein
MDVKDMTPTAADIIAAATKFIERAVYDEGGGEWFAALFDADV